MKDSEFIRQLYEETSGKLMKYIVHMCGNRDLAEDILQETYFEALLRKSELTKHDNAVDWLFRTASYKLSNALRKAERQNVSIDVLVGEQEPKKSDNGYATCEYKMTIETVLNKQELELVWLHYLLGYSWKEISKADGVSEGALKTQMFRIKKKLQRELRKEF